MDALLLLLLDGRAPAGAHNHSGGMEEAVNAELVLTVPDVAAFCRGRLLTSGRVTSAFAAAACRLTQQRAPRPAWVALDEELDARTPSEAMRTASRQMGRGLRRLLQAMIAADEPPWGPNPHHAIVLGAACGLAGATPQLAARAAALGVCTGPASAAVRLLGLDPYAVHGVLAALATEIDAVADAAAATATLPAHSAPGLDLLAEFHLTREVRLFAS